MNQPASNRLIKESSPYLKQHAFNPVDWYPWGPEAFTRAQAEDKPVFLSIGYSSCHWCHVMEHESFENEDVASVLNKYFISIKVDREEHPEIDAFYMTVTQIMTGHGGWPNSIWLMPDKRPWYAGTYFPREDRPGRIGFRNLLLKLSEVWTKNRTGVEEQAVALIDAIRRNQHATSGRTIPDRSAIDWARHVQEYYRSQFDARFGGFGGAPKFPPHSGLLLLMRTLDFAPSSETEVIITTTLDAMMRGGLYDQIGGGFHRYSTDEEWRLPHFEKMLYDNAMLLKVYAIAAQRFDRPDYRRVVRETSQWLSREMTHPDGGFFSALDADSGGEEGLFYTWTKSEIIDLLGVDDGEWFCDLYQILPGGNFHDEATGVVSGRNIPHLKTSVSEAGINRASALREILLGMRSKREKPGLDHKIIAGWNGLMIAALANAGRVLNDQELLIAARRAHSFIKSHLARGASLHRCWCEGEPRHAAVLEDHAAIALANVELYQATQEIVFLEDAKSELGIMLDKFYDRNDGEIFMASEDLIVPGVRLQDVYDQGSPGGLGIAVEALIRYGTVAGDKESLQTGRDLALKKAYLMDRAPSAVASLVNGYLSAPFADDVSFHLRDLSKSDDGYSAIVHLSCQMAEDLKLNQAFGPSQQAELDVRWRNPETPIRISVKAKANNSWTVEFTSDELLKGTRTLIVRHQLCTAAECRPERDEELTVDFG